jgi:hypothetical protein
MLLNVPQELLRRAATPGLAPAEMARLAMYAVAMDILLICPMRRKTWPNCGSIIISTAPTRVRRRLTHLLILSDDVKNGNAIEWPIPPETARMIEDSLLRDRRAGRRIAQHAFRQTTMPSRPSSPACATKATARARLPRT